LPLPQCCTLPAHEEATLPCVSCCDGHCCRCCCRSHCNRGCPLCHRRHCRRRWQSPSPLPSAIAITVAADHRRCPLRCRRPCHCNRCWPLPLPLPLAIAFAVAIGHRRCCCCLPLPFEQFKQIMLTLFYLLWAVSGALIAAHESGGNGCWPTPALGSKWRAISG
jgi:hypothetical protein